MSVRRDVHKVNPDGLRQKMRRELSPQLKDNAYCLEYALIQIKVRSESRANAREHARRDLNGFRVQ